VAVCHGICRLIIHHALNHPNIVKMRDIVLEPDHLNIVMEYVEGQNLFVHLKDRPVRYTEGEAR
jgi:serine/threonine protein kinase